MIQDNQQAFPSQKFEIRGGEYHPLDTVEGMTLRDYFAGQALPTWALVLEKDECAKKCYEYADAMLAQRSKKED